MKEYFREIEGGVCAPKGFSAASHAAGIKYQGRDDMALIFSDTPCITAGTFTSNNVKAAPVIWDLRIVHSEKKVRAVVANSGIANAATGKPGMEICEKTAAALSECYGGDKDEVLVASTGVIGMQIDTDRITAGCRALYEKRAAGTEAATAAARAIMTTDTKKKEISVELSLSDGKTVRIGAMTKGSGMIHPNMCTMLGFVTTDAAIDKALLQKALTAIVDESFNMISVDGDTSTNDTYVVLSNGEAGNRLIDTEDEDYERFFEALRYVSLSLARRMAADGEGASCLFECKVSGARSLGDARMLAKSVIGSSLCKAAIFGNDSNFGRFLCALGYSGVSFDPEQVDIWYESAAGKLKIVEGGLGTDYDEAEATKLLDQPEVTVLVDMHMGNESATAWGCDLSYDYVKINADYRS
ncbi:MAG: bifunctional glutamate N-acetyltransferase/amino-acid acetyltransferase ArgJ [Lachnospiraceae bacterium]|nr:bifunctional glutamate N-acetyltransferase/amino-acid acetyltransferase ArgJ [Lachnospiraceae bacterium]